MGLFGSLFGKQNTTESSGTKDTAKKESSGSLNELLGKDVNWFLSEEGIRAFEEYNTEEAFKAEKRAVLQNNGYVYEDEFFFSLRDPVCVQLKNPRDPYELKRVLLTGKTPYKYASALYEACDSEMAKKLQTKWNGGHVYDVIIGGIERLSNADDNGKRLLSPEEVASLDHNAVLQFVCRNEIINEFASLDDKSHLAEDGEKSIVAAIRFIVSKCIEGEKTVLGTYPWLFDKNNYADSGWLTIDKKIREEEFRSKYEEYVGVDFTYDIERYPKGKASIKLFTSRLEDAVEMEREDEANFLAKLFLEGTLGKESADALERVCKGELGEWLTLVEPKDIAELKDGEATIFRHMVTSDNFIKWASAEPSPSYMDFLMPYKAAVHELIDKAYIDWEEAIIWKPGLFKKSNFDEEVANAFIEEDVERFNEEREAKKKKGPRPVVIK